MAACDETSALHLPFSRPLAVDDVPAEGIDLTVAATEPERRAIAAEDGLEDLAKLEADLHIAPWGRDGLAVTGEMRARITQICVVSLDPFDTEVVEPVDVKFAPVPEAAPPSPPERKGKERPAGRRRGLDHDIAAAPVREVFLDEREPPDPLIDGRIDLGAIVAEFLALGLDPYPKKPGVAFEGAATPEPYDEAKESPFARLGALKDGLPPRS